MTLLNVNDVTIELFDVSGNNLSVVEGITEISFSKTIDDTIGTTQIVIQEAGVDDIVDTLFKKGRELDIIIDADGFNKNRLGRLIVQDYSIDYANNPNGITTVDVECESYVFSKLRDRKISINLRDENIETAVQTILDSKTGLDINLDFRAESLFTVNGSYSFEPLLNVIGNIVTDQYQLKFEDKTLIVDDLPTTQKNFDINDVANISKDVVGQPVSDIRVEGGQVNIEIDDAKQETQTDRRKLLDVNGGSKIFSTPLVVNTNSEVTAVNLATRGNSTNFDGTLNARLHPDQNGEPKNPGDESSAIATVNLDSNFVGENGTRIEFDENTIKQSVVHLVVTQSVNTSNDNGAIGVAGETIDEFRPSVTKVERSLPIVIKLSNQATRDEYGIRERKIQRDNIQSIQEARQVANRRLVKLSEPEEKITADARAEKIHNIDVLDVLQANSTGKGFEENQIYVVTDVEHTIAGTQLSTSVELLRPSRL
jgi:hypothetical protein